MGEKIAWLVRFLSIILGQEDLKRDCLENEMIKRKKEERDGNKVSISSEYKRESFQKETKLNHCYISHPEIKRCTHSVALVTCCRLKHLLLNITVTNTQKPTKQNKQRFSLPGKLQGLKDMNTMCGLCHALDSKTRGKEAVVPWKWPWHWLSAVLQSRAVPSSLPVSRRCPSGLRLSQLMPPW